MCSHPLLHSMWHKAGEPETCCHAHSHPLSHTMWYMAGKKNANRIHTGFYTQCNGGLRIKPSAFTPAFTHNATQGWWNQRKNTNQPLHSYEDRRPCLPMYSGWGIWSISSWWLENREETLHSHGYIHSADCWLITSHVRTAICSLKVLNIKKKIVINPGPYII